MKNTKAEKNKACHSRGMLSGIYNACRCKIGKDALLNGYVEDPRYRHSGMTPNLMGFTLIELLVVVLIIGILAAVAVPQYQKAVAKSRFAALKPIVKSIKNAEEIYYNGHGTYGALADLDVQAPAGSVALSETSGHDYVRASSSSGNRYTVYFNHSDNFAGNVYCEAEKDNTIAESVCVAEQGVDTELVQDGHKLYLMSGNSTGEFAAAPFESIQWNGATFAYSNGSQTVVFTYQSAGNFIIDEYDSNDNLVSSKGMLVYDICADYSFVTELNCGG